MPPYDPAENIQTDLPHQKAFYARADKLTASQLAQGFELLDECDQYLRAIRSENLDGSEPLLGALLERTAGFFRQAHADLGTFASPDAPSGESERKEGTSFKVGDWICRRDTVQIGRVGGVQPGGSLDIAVYDREGARITRANAIAGASTVLRDFCQPENWAVIEPPTFPLPPGGHDECVRFVGANAVIAADETESDTGAPRPAG